MSTTPTLRLSLLFFTDTATTEIYTLSLHDALPIWSSSTMPGPAVFSKLPSRKTMRRWYSRSEEHTSELQSRGHLVCRLLLEKKKKIQKKTVTKTRSINHTILYHHNVKNTLNT